MYQLGDKLKALRLKRNLSQVNLAEKLNKMYGTTINKGMISKWENNLSEPKLETARFLSMFFNVTLDELLGVNDDVQTIAAHHDGEDWTEEELETIKKFKEFVKSQRSKQE